jgi:hypothetical protein
MSQQHCCRGSDAAAEVMFHLWVDLIWSPWTRACGLMVVGTVLAPFPLAAQIAQMQHCEKNGSTRILTLSMLVWT